MAIYEDSYEGYQEMLHDYHDEQQALANLRGRYQEPGTPEASCWSMVEGILRVKTWGKTALEKLNDYQADVVREERPENILLLQVISIAIKELSECYK